MMRYVLRASIGSCSHVLRSRARSSVTQNFEVAVPLRSKPSHDLRAGPAEPKYWWKKAPGYARKHRGYAADLSSAGCDRRDLPGHERRRSNAASTWRIDLNHDC